MAISNEQRRIDIGVRVMVTLAAAGLALWAFAGDCRAHLRRHGFHGWRWSHGLPVLRHRYRHPSRHRLEWQ